MEDSWRFDGSIVSLSESTGPPPAVAPRRFDRDLNAASSEEGSARSETHAGGAPCAATDSEASPGPAVALSAALIDAAPPAPLPLTMRGDDTNGGPTSNAIIPPHAPRGAGRAAPTAAPLEALHTREPYEGAGPASRGRPAASARHVGHATATDPAAAAAETTTRSTSVSSVTSTDGSAASYRNDHQYNSDAGSASEQDSGAGGATSAFVMPSLNLAGRTHGRHSHVSAQAAHTDASTRSPTTTEHSSEPGPEPEPGPRRGSVTGCHGCTCPCGTADPRARILVLGSSAEDRRTLAKLVSLDEYDDNDHHHEHERDRDDPAGSERRQSPGSSAGGATDLSFSFLSSPPPTRPAEPAGDAAFQALAPRARAARLFHLADATLSTASLLDKLQLPFERLEAKLSRTYPATDALVELVSSRPARCGAFDACLFLFSSR